MIQCRKNCFIITFPAKIKNVFYKQCNIIVHITHSCQSVMLYQAISFHTGRDDNPLTLVLCGLPLPLSSGVTWLLPLSVCKVVPHRSCKPCSISVVAGKLDRLCKVVL